MITLLRIGFVLLVVIAGSIGISRLDFDVDPLSLLPKDLPGLEGTRLLRDQKAHLLVVTVQGDVPETVALAADELARHLAAMPELCAQVRSRTLLESEPEVVAEAVAFAWLNAPPAEVQALAARLQPAALPGLLQRAMDVLGSSPDVQEVMLTGYDPLGLARGAMALMLPGGRSSSAPADEFTSADGKLHLLFVKPPVAALKDYRTVHAWLEELRSEVRQKWLPSMPALAGVHIGFTGDPAFQAEIATGMESDMKQSISGITLIVGFLFWLLHRSLKPLLWIMLAILCANLLTLGTAGLIYGSLNVMSMGFAAILTGLIEDFGVIGLHDAREHPGDSFQAVCRRVLPSVAWSACTTAGIFAMLGLSQLPGVAQLGLLSALGVLIGAAVMLFGFLPLGMRAGKLPEAALRISSGDKVQQWTGWFFLALMLAATAGLGGRGWPQIELDSSVLRPVKSEAFDVLETLEQKMTRSGAEGEMVPVVFTAKDAPAMRAALSQAGQILHATAAKTEVKSFSLPTALVPDATAQRANLPHLQALAAGNDAMQKAMVDAGFEDSAFALGGAVLDRWKKWAAQPESLPRWLDPTMEENLGGLISQHTKHGVMALASVELTRGLTPGRSDTLHALQAVPGAHPGGWSYLGESLQPLLKQEVNRICLPALALVLLLLPFVFRGWREVLLAIGTLVFSGWILCGGMALLGLKWNLMSLGAIPLCLGLGLDFTIHMMHALRHHAADRARIASLGRALAYCGLSTGLAFGALAMGGNRGLISLGLTAMIGVLTVLVTAAFALPWVWFRWPGSGRIK